MLSSLRIHNFRALQDLHVPQLGRINLIVGKNNSGKSSILEALRIYGALANRDLLDALVDQHDEIAPTQAGARDEDDGPIPYQSFFTGRRYPVTDGDGIYIGDQTEQDFVRITHQFYLQKRIAIPVPGGENALGIERVLIPKDQAADESEAEPALFVTSSRIQEPRWLRLRTQSRIRRPMLTDPEALPVGYVPPGLLPSSALADHWDSIALTNYDEVIRRGLRIIEPRVDGIAFVKRDDLRRRPELDRTPIVKLAGADRPVALNSMGDGMMRVLQLLLLLAPARGGLYLVDEFENGLHYSVQERVWEMIFELAKANDVQVFAATHSWDCIEAFKNISLRSAESALLFRVGRSAKTSEKDKAIATVFDKDSLAKLTQMDVEVR